MTTRLHTLWDALRTTFWCLPALMMAGSIGLSSAAVRVDEALTSQASAQLEWTGTRSPEGARDR